MERKKYLELMQANSVYPKSIVLEYKGVRYYPEKLVVWFENGIVKNSARMRAVVGTSAIECDLSEITRLDNI